jgi:hypothetical protein
MSSMPWVKMYTEMLDDTKLGRLNNATRWRFVSLVLLAGECDAEGYLANGTGAMSTDDIAWRLRCNPAKLARELDTLANVGLIANTANGWQVIKFSERQGRTQSEKRQMWNERQAKHRQNDSSLTQKNHGPSWELPENPEKTPPVTRDTRVTHASRVEKSRVEKSNGASAPPSNPKPRPQDELFNAIVKVCAVDISVEGNSSSVGKVRAALANAKPPYSPAEVLAWGQTQSWRHEPPTVWQLKSGIGAVRSKNGSPAAGPSRTPAL